MCLAVPVRVVTVADDGLSAVGESFGVKKNISLEMLDASVVPGDYVLLHVGFAIRKVDIAAAEQTLADHMEMARRLKDD